MGQESPMLPEEILEWNGQTPDIWQKVNHSNGIKIVLLWRPNTFRMSRGRPQIRLVDDLKLAAGLKWIQRRIGKDEN